MRYVRMRTVCPAIVTKAIYMAEREEEEGANLYFDVGFWTVVSFVIAMVLTEKSETRVREALALIDHSKKKGGGARRVTCQYTSLQALHWNGRKSTRWF